LRMHSTCSFLIVIIACW